MYSSTVENEDTAENHQSQNTTFNALLPNESYICLGYVLDSKSSAKAPAKSKLVPATVPKIISDLIYVSEQLGIPRLWVDQ